MVVELGGIAEIGDAGDRAVVQMMAVDDVVRVGEVGAVLGRQEDGAERGDPAFRSLEVVRKVLLVVGRLHDGVVHHGAGNVDPPHRVGIDGLERIPVHREVGERRGRQIVGRRETLPRDIVIGLLTLPVTEADGTERGQRHDEHHERDPEHHAPRPALLPRPSGTGLLIGRLLSIRVASASSRSALGRLSGAVGGMLRGRRPVAPLPARRARRPSARAAAQVARLEQGRDAVGTRTCSPFGMIFKRRNPAVARPLP